MEARAVRKHIRSGPKKVRTVINVVRGKTVPEALNILNFLPQEITGTVKLTILSAVHNLMDLNKDERIDEDLLVVKEIKVDSGPAFKRFRPAPRGRAHRILKRTSHLTVVVGTPGSDSDVVVASDAASDSADVATKSSKKKAAAKKTTAKKTTAKKTTAKKAAAKKKTAKKTTAKKAAKKSPAKKTSAKKTTAKKAASKKTAAKKKDSE